MSDAEKSEKKSGFAQALPAITLMILAPLMAELLPGATRISSAFVFPIEILVWGGGAVMARFLTRKYRLGWFNLLLLALALAVGEECIIQQTSLAPLVIKLKGVEYARAYGVNYVYFLWALLYEAIFVVLVPVGLTELIFPKRRDDHWLNGWGVGIICVLFTPGCMAAWYGWTQMARVQIFHLPAYDLPQNALIAGVAAIAVLVGLAVGPFRRMLAAMSKPINPPHPMIVAVLGSAVSVVIFGLTLLGFGMQPDFPPAAAMAIGIGLALAMMAVVPGWMTSPKWSHAHDVAMLYSVGIGNMAIMFVGFIGATTIDLYGKIIIDTIAVVLMIWLAIARLGKRV